MLPDFPAREGVEIGRRHVTTPTERMGIEAIYRRRNTSKSRRGARSNREAYEVAPICKVLPIVPSTNHEHAARRCDPETAPAQVRRGAVLRGEIRRVFDENIQFYEVRKTWRRLQTRARPWPGNKQVKTKLNDKSADNPIDKARRQFRAPRPNALSGGDVTYVVTRTGFVYVAARQTLRVCADVIDAFARRIVGWRVSRTAHASFVCDALEQALHDRRPVHGGGLVHHSDRGRRYVSIKYSQRLVEAGLVASVGDSVNNALAETINGLYKAEVIHRRGPWRSLEAVEYAALAWVDWFNNHRLLEPVGNRPPAEAEARNYPQAKVTPKLRDSTRTPPEKSARFSAPEARLACIGGLTADVRRLRLEGCGTVEVRERGVRRVTSPSMPSGVLTWRHLRNRLDAESQHAIFAQRRSAISDTRISWLPTG